MFIILTLLFTAVASHGCGKRPVPRYLQILQRARRRLIPKINSSPK